MKAIEYFEKYNPILLEAKAKNQNTLNNFHDLLMEFSEEIVKIYNLRHGNSTSALKSVILEQNQKWNALGAIFKHHYGSSPLKRDGFKNYWADKMPELALVIKTTNEMKKEVSVNG